MSSRYIPFTQQKYCCVPACIQMVMYKNKINLIDQETIGNALGLTVPEEDAYLFSNPRLGEMPRAGWGTQIYKEEFTPNVAFQKLGIPLTMTMDLIDNFIDVDRIISFLSEGEAKDKDILVCYDYGTLFDTNYHGGHVNVFDSYYPESGMVTLIDPEQLVPKYRAVPFKKLFDALIRHGSERSGGFWTLEKT